MFQNKKISLFALFANFEAKQTQNWGALQVNVLHINQTFFKACFTCKKTFPTHTLFECISIIYRSTGQRSMFGTSTFCRSTALYINKNLLKYRTKCHLKMLCRSMALYINHCWSKNHISFILFHRSIIICLLC